MVIKNLFLKKNHANTAVKKTKEKHEQTIFQEAASWADDLYATQVARTAQYRLAALLLLILSFALVFAIAVMMPLEKTALIVVHTTNNGVTWVDPPQEFKNNITQAQTESEIINYITHREGYSAFSYEEQYKQVVLMSSNKTADEYIQEQSMNNPHSPVLQLGEEGVRRVTVESIIFMDTEKQTTQKIEPKHHNLAQINFTVTTDKQGQKTMLSYVALLSWEYRGTPVEPEAKWKNWDGFTVMQYSVSQRNLKKL